MKKFLITKNILIFALLIFIMAIISLGSGYSRTMIEGILLWSNCVLPSLFPYLFLINIINGLNLTNGIDKLLSPISNKIFNVNGRVFVVYLISLLSGFPVGAKMIADLKNKNLLSETESIRGSAFCSTPSPSFLISTVGGVFFNNIKIGLLLFLSSTISSIIIGIIFSFYKRNDKPTNSIIIQNIKSKNLLYDSVYSSVISVLVVGGLISIFYLFINILLKFNILLPLQYFFNIFIKDNSYSKSLSIGTFEITTGLSYLAKGKISTLSISLSSFICGFSGISVIIQSTAFLKMAKIKTAPFIASKLLSAVFNFFITYFLCLIFL